VTLADRLAVLDADDQGALARREAGDATTPELIAALRIAPLGEWAALHMTYELAQRGPVTADLIANTLTANPTGAGYTALGEALVDLFRYNHEARPRAAAALIAATEAALEAGGGSHSAAGTFVAQLADCATIAGTLEEAAPVARRLLEVAARESSPRAFAVMSARRLVGKADDP
jgi:hypothetical protein